jgi:hypothetical protein
VSTALAPSTNNVPIPIRERISCSIEEALHASSLGRTTFNSLIQDGTIASRKVGRRRLVIVSSLVAYIEGGEA